MGDVVTLPVIRIERYADEPNDGGKSRIRARRERFGQSRVKKVDMEWSVGSDYTVELIGLAKQGGPVVEPDSLVMLRPDPELPCDCA